MNANGYPGFNVTLYLLTLVKAEQNAAEIWMHAFDEFLLYTVWVSHYYPKSIKLERHDHVTLFLDATLISCGHCGRMSVSIEMCFISAI